MSKFLFSLPWVFILMPSKEQTGIMNKIEAMQKQDAKAGMGDKIIINLPFLETKAGE